MNLPEKMNSKLAITVANEVLADCRTIKEAIDELHLLPVTFISRIPFARWGTHRLRETLSIAVI